MTEVRSGRTCQKAQRSAGLPDAEFWGDERNLYTVLHLLLIAIEATAALCNHVNSQNRPTNAGELLRVLRGIARISQPGRL